MSLQKRNSEYKIKLFAGLFQGLQTAYGTYCPETGKHRQVKHMVTKSTIYRHLKGIEPYGFYPLVRNMTRIGAVDFDNHDPEHPLAFIASANKYMKSLHVSKGPLSVLRTSFPQGGQEKKARW